MKKFFISMCVALVGIMLVACSHDNSTQHYKSKLDEIGKYGEAGWDYILITVKEKDIELTRAPWMLGSDRIPKIFKENFDGMEIGYFPYYAPSIDESDTIIVFYKNGRPVHLVTNYIMEKYPIVVYEELKKAWWGRNYEDLERTANRIGNEWMQDFQNWKNRR